MQKITKEYFVNEKLLKSAYGYKLYNEKLVSHDFLSLSCELSALT